MTRRGSKATGAESADSAAVAAGPDGGAAAGAAHAGAASKGPDAGAAADSAAVQLGVELIDDAEAAAEDAPVPGDRPGTDARLTPDLSVGRGVIVEVARLAALEIPDVLRVARRGPPWRAALAGPAIMVRVRPEGVTVKLRIIARPGADLVAATTHVQDAVGRAVERLLGLHVREVTVLVDGVGG